MFTRNKELQSLVYERTNALKNAESKIEKMNTRITSLEKQVNYQFNDKKELSKENSKQKEFITKLIKLVVSNKYNNEKAALAKIKELVHDYQSQN